jgi:hypothetical protein
MARICCALGFCRFTRQSFGYVTNDTFAERLERAVAASERAKLIEGRVNVMIDHQIDEELILIDEVSDEVVEAAALVALGGFPTLIYGTYCFACPASPCAKLLSAPHHCDYGVDFACARAATP